MEILDGKKTSAQVREELRREVVAEDKAGCCQRLLRLALERGAPDNVTAVLVQL